MGFIQQTLCLITFLVPFLTGAFAPHRISHSLRHESFRLFVNQESAEEISASVAPTAVVAEDVSASVAPKSDVLEAKQESDSLPANLRMYTAKEVTTAERPGQNSFDEVDTRIFVRPKLFDEVKLAGDNGFDPFGLATDKAVLLSYRGAELRHARLAMLATVGWPISELVQPKLAAALGLPAAISTGGTAPSVLNGGLGNINPIFWLVAIGAAVAIEFKSLDMEKSGAMPGDVGFDPLGMNSPQMAEAEMLNGRLAMLAITGFAIQEAASKISGSPVPVIQETPQFFKPFFM